MITEHRVYVTGNNKIEFMKSLGSFEFYYKKRYNAWYNELTHCLTFTLKKQYIDAVVMTSNSSTDFEDVRDIQGLKLIFTEKEFTELTAPVVVAQVCKELQLYFI